MQAWVLVFLIVTAILFATKILYVIAAGWMVPITRRALVVSTGPVRIRAFLDAVPMSPREVIVDQGCVWRWACPSCSTKGLWSEDPWI